MHGPFIYTDGKITASFAAQDVFTYNVKFVLRQLSASFNYEAAYVRQYLPWVNFSADKSLCDGYDPERIDQHFLTYFILFFAQFSGA